MGGCFFCGIDAPNELYRNLGGWRFEKKPLPEALALPGFPSRGACWVDINEDARLDLLLTTVGVALTLSFSRMAGNGYRHQTMQGSRSKGELVPWLWRT